MKVLELTDYLSICLADHAELPFFYQREYASFVQKTENKQVFVAVDTEHSTIAFKKWKGKLLSFIQPLYPPLGKDLQRLPVEDEKRFLNDFVKTISDQKFADRITQGENFAIFHATPTNSISAPFGTYYLDLSSKTEDELFAGLHSKHRNVIRNAEKNAVELRYGKEVLDDFYDLHSSTSKRSELYCPSKKYFENYLDMLKSSVVCGVAYKNGIPLGGLLVPYSKFGAFYVYGASAGTISVTGAINYLHWNLICELKKQGVRRYDFVGARLSDVSGSKLDGIQQFKERFGATLEEGFLWKIDINPMKGKIFDYLLNFKLKLRSHPPLLDIIDQERKKVWA